MKFAMKLVKLLPNPSQSGNTIPPLPPRGDDSWRKMLPRRSTLEGEVRREMTPRKAQALDLPSVAKSTSARADPLRNSNLSRAPSQMSRTLHQFPLWCRVQHWTRKRDTEQSHHPPTDRMSLLLAASIVHHRRCWRRGRCLVPPHSVEASICNLVTWTLRHCRLPRLYSPALGEHADSEWPEKALEKLVWR